MSVIISKAGLADLEDLAPLFDGYRVFYGQSSDLPRAVSFLADHFKGGRSVVFLARLNGKAAGFTQLYPSFSSVRTKAVWILNDLFVSPEARTNGIAERLMSEVSRFALENGSAYVQLETAADNHEAQALYEKMGYKKNTGFFTYVWEPPS